MSAILGWFYDHLARLLYGKATSWKPMHVTQLREYVDSSRKAHYLEGYASEYILPNSENLRPGKPALRGHRRTRRRNTELERPSPVGSALCRSRADRLAVAEAFNAVGIFSAAGLCATADIWGELNFVDTQDYRDAERLTQQLLERLIAESLPSDAAMREHVQQLYEHWQLPMYHLDFKIIDVPFEELQRERDSALWAEAGVHPDEY